MAAPPPPPLPVELVEEILLRLPPDDPACLLRASLVCKTWGGAVSHPAFRRRLHELHRTPPVLGFLHNWYKQDIPRFIPTTASSFSLAAPDFRSWSAIDCRHGRALFLPNGKDTKELLVWEPITGAQRRVPMPASSDYWWWQSAAVFCAADGCNHHDCHGGPFHLVFVFYVEEDTNADRHLTSACLYSSETGAWVELTLMQGDFVSLYSGDFDIDYTVSSSVLVGRSLLYFMSDDGRTLECDLARHGLTVLDPPKSGSDYDRFNLMLAEDGGLGLSQAVHTIRHQQAVYQHLKLWSRKASDGTSAQWVLSRVICLENLLPNDALVDTEGGLDVLGFAEGVNVIFVITDVGLFTIELQSERVTKICDNHGYSNLIPFVSFYTPHSRLEALVGEHQYPPLPSRPTEEVDGEEGEGEEEETLEQTQDLFDKCKTMEEGNFTNASDGFSHTLEIRVPHHGELLPDDPSENVSKNAPNEESVKNTSTSSKDGPGSSEAYRGLHGASEEGFGRSKR